MDDRTASLVRGLVCGIFGGTWVAMVIRFGAAFRRMSVAEKSLWYPRFALLVGALFVLFVTTLSVLENRAWSSFLISLLFLVPITLAITYWNIRFTRFCGRCNARIFTGYRFTRAKFCPQCGANLDAVEPSTLVGPYGYTRSEPTLDPTPGGEWFERGLWTVNDPDR